MNKAFFSTIVLSLICGYVVNPILFVLDDKVWLFSTCVLLGGGNIENYCYDHLCYVIDLKTKTMEQMTYDDSVDISNGLGILAEGNKKYLIVGGVTHGTEGSPTDGISYRPYWVLDLDSLTFEPYDGSIPIYEYQAGYSLKKRCKRKVYRLKFQRKVFLQSDF